MGVEMESGGKEKSGYKGYRLVDSGSPGVAESGVPNRRPYRRLRVCHGAHYAHGEFIGRPRRLWQRPSDARAPDSSYCGSVRTSDEKLVAKGRPGGFPEVRGLDRGGNHSFRFTGYRGDFPCYRSVTTLWHAYDPRHPTQSPRQSLMPPWMWWVHRTSGIVRRCQILFGVRGVNDVIP